MLGTHLGNLDLGAERRHGAALAEANALLSADPAEVDHRLDEARRSEHLGARALGQIHGVARTIGPSHRPDVIGVAMGDQDHVDLAELVETLELRRRLGVVGHEGIDHDHLAPRRGDLRGRLTEPVDFGLGRLRPRRLYGEGEGGGRAQFEKIPSLHVAPPWVETRGPRRQVYASDQPIVVEEWRACSDARTNRPGSGVTHADLTSC